MTASPRVTGPAPDQDDRVPLGVALIELRRVSIGGITRVGPSGWRPNWPCAKNRADRSCRVRSAGHIVLTADHLTLWSAVFYWLVAAGFARCLRRGVRCVPSGDLQPDTLYQSCNLEFNDAMFVWVYNETLPDGEDHWVVGTGYGRISIWIWIGSSNASRICII